MKWILILVLMLLCFVCSLIYWYYNEIWLLGFNDYPAAFGQMGDFFGGLLNPVLAFSSFIALLYTIFIQTKQLEISRKELIATRAELKASIEAQQESSRALKGQLDLLQSQKFYDIFYKMVADIERSIFNDFTDSPYAYSIQSDTTNKLGRSEHDVEILFEIISEISVKNKVSKSIHEVCGDIFIFVENASISEDDKSLCFRRLQLLLTESTTYLLALYYNKIMAKISPDGYVDTVFEIIKKRKLLRGGQFTSTPSSFFIEFNSRPAFMIQTSVLGYEVDDIGIVGFEWTTEE